MSSDIKQRLLYRNASTPQDAALDDLAIARIEALEAEVERLQVECAENERLWEEARNLAELNGEVADSAMKCAERLRVALEGMVHYSQHAEHWQGDNPQFVEAAVKALEDDKQ